MIIYVKTALQTEVLNCLLNKTFMFSREDDYGNIVRYDKMLLNILFKI